MEETGGKKSQDRIKAIPIHVRQGSHQATRLYPSTIPPSVGAVILRVDLASGNDIHRSRQSRARPWLPAGIGRYQLLVAMQSICARKKHGRDSGQQKLGGDNGTPRKSLLGAAGYLLMCSGTCAEHAGTQARIQGVFCEARQNHCLLWDMFLFCLSADEAPNAMTRGACRDGTIAHWDPEWRKRKVAPCYRRCWQFNPLKPSGTTRLKRQIMNQALAPWGSI